MALLELAVLLTIWRTHFSAAQQVPLLCGTSGLGPRSWARAPPPRRARRLPPAASGRPSSREVRCGAASRLRSATPAWEASALAARPPSGDLRVARLPCRFLVRERALTPLLHFRPARLAPQSSSRGSGRRPNSRRAGARPTGAPVTPIAVTPRRHRAFYNRHWSVAAPLRPPASRRPPAAHLAMHRSSNLRPPCRMKSSGFCGFCVGHVLACSLSRQMSTNL